MTADITATGRREVRAGVPHVVLERSFSAPVDAVWAAITEPTRLERWIGTWAGDPADGFVDFRMTAEGEDVESERFTILECDPPRRLVVESKFPAQDGGEDVWRLELDLAEAHGTTILSFAQGLPRADMAENVGPGWEYYLDRLVAAEAGRSVAEVDWDAYYPALSSSYADLFRD
ncbi:MULTISPECIES: SRPBCC domain-containing protein [unclassified Gordonia (in: high G+C Gram-positive bacteria)]|uniref:SRPBCC domain-containing protein n=1 Tax=unclassified Gordonia (in: high G+C Gram-positive bacteria) TaxID=2657482 RepID=UPI0019633F00|nr:MULTISPECIES: SRPBCC domain-containing protein [unclassified Gordonia (in: high G+C Gram-positive bacteria)]MBN0974248.1 SRPBCC domain-containing protein [Gordonia sp. BP-119]MBN0981898.1 SRPBCC domain-containing protein [Gordonia sp. BP-94]